MTKRGMAFITAALMIWVAAVPAFAADVPYPDVSADHWAYEAIESLHNAGLVEGYPDGTYGGERTFTRYEMAMVFSRILKRLDGRMDLLAGSGVDVDALLDEFGSELGLINALTVAIANAQEAAETAADRAYRARLTATQALAQAEKAEDSAQKALAIAEQGGEARVAAQRAQRVAADAEAAALRATAIAERAFAMGAGEALERARQAELAAEYAQEVAENALQSAINAGKLAVEARTSGDAQRALEEVERVTDLVMQADRLAYLAQLSAARALELAEDAHARIDELVLFGGEVKAEYKQWSEDADSATFGVDVKLTATAQVTDDVNVVGGVELKQDVLADATKDLDKNKVHAKITTPGFLRSVSFSTEANDEDRTNDFALTFGMPIAIVDLELDVGYEREVEAGANFFRNWRQVGFSDADILGFGMDFHYYMADREGGVENTVVRAHAARAIDLGALPLDLGFTIATVLEGNDAVGPHVGVDLKLEDYALSDALTFNAGLEFAQNPFDEWTHPETWVDDQVLTASAGVGLDLLGGQLDTKVEIGVMGNDNVKASADFAYPLADGMNSSVGVEFDKNKDDVAVKAGLGVKF